MTPFNEEPSGGKNYYDDGNVGELDAHGRHELGKLLRKANPPVTERSDALDLLLSKLGEQDNQ